MNIETWKSTYEPRYYEDSGAECFDHDECECRFLHTYFPDEIEDEDVEYDQIWTWHEDGTITPGMTGEDLLITEKPWTNQHLEITK